MEMEKEDMPPGLSRLWEMHFALCISSYPVDRMFPISEGRPDPFPVEPPLTKEEGVHQQSTQLWNASITWGSAVILAPLALCFALDLVLYEKPYQEVFFFVAVVVEI